MTKRPKQRRVGTVSNPLRMDSLEVNPETRALLDRIERERQTERAKDLQRPSAEELEIRRIVRDEIKRSG